MEISIVYSRLSHDQSHDPFFITFFFLLVQARGTLIFRFSDSNVLRVEALPEGWFEYNCAFTAVTEFYGKTMRNDSNAVDTSDTMDISDADITREAGDTSNAVDNPKLANGIVYTLQ